MAGTPVPAPNKARALEGAVVSALIILVPILQPYLNKLSWGPLIIGIVSAIVVGAVAFIKSLASPGDTTTIVSNLSDLQTLVEAIPATVATATAKAETAASTASIASETAIKAQTDARAAVTAFNTIANATVSAEKGTTL